MTRYVKISKIEVIIIELQFHFELKFKLDFNE